MRLTLLPLITALALGACYSQFSSVKHDSVKQVLMPVHMVSRQIVTENFTLMSYDRIHDWKGGPAKLYIEGETDNWIDRSKLSWDATPRSPVGAQLAGHDGAQNVVWLGRPCQYVATDQGLCKNEDYWNTAQFAPEVVASYHQALDNIKARYGITSFDVVGYSGGGVIAALLAAERDDITTLRTVAAPLDHMAFTQIHKLESWTKSKNPADAADRLATVPQRHFIGAQDQVVPAAVYHSYVRALGDTNCVSSTLVEDADHVRDWASKWPELLLEPVSCESAVLPLNDPRSDRKRAYQDLIGPKK